MIARFQNTETEIKGSLCYWDTWPIAGKWEAQERTQNTPKHRTGYREDLCYSD